jgi:hypothetical protein
VLLDFGALFSLPLQFVLVESIKRFPVTLDEASAKVFTGDERPVDVRDDAEPLIDEAVPDVPSADVKPDDETCNCCHGGILSLPLSNRLASSNEIFFLLTMTCFAGKTIDLEHAFVSSISNLVRSLFCHLLTCRSVMFHLVLSLSRQEYLHSAP